MILTHRRVFMMISDPLKGVFDAFNPMGILFRESLCTLPTEGIPVIFG